MSKPRDDRQKDLLRPALDQMINLEHPLVRLAREIDWDFLAGRFAWATQRLRSAALERYDHHRILSNYVALNAGEGQFGAWTHCGPMRERTSACIWDAVRASPASPSLEPIPASLCEDGEGAA